MRKRIVICLCFIFFISSILGYVVYKVNKKNEKDMIVEEYIPQEEISDSQIRNTMVSLYFKDTNGLIPEVRLVDVKSLINNPYEEILKMLIKGPKNENLQKTIPEGTKINKIEKINDYLVVDLSKEFIENHKGGEKEERCTINSIVYTLSELTEINGIKIKIDGKDDQKFKDGIIKFDKVFKRKDN